jgi:hypothetical protein
MENQRQTSNLDKNIPKIMSQGLPSLALLDPAYPR